MTLYHIIKTDDQNLLCHAIRKIYIILQVPAVSKPKYAKVILKPIHIIDTKATSSIF